MRITKEQIDLLKSELQKLSKEARLYLFGSRVNDEKRGGDIDLLIISDSLTKKDIRKLRIEFFKHFGEQKLDIVLDNSKLEKPFVKLILPKAVRL
ncbi:nucleotidyltransferase domain-containing protein [Hydrogenimonas thermophila]|uniref:Nucleotidyltransferase domain-containing protein n=1 Tax=Hydrogenimonas thermophila TaxID=223786 RepID=A0A1I5TN00_9BACT|nr:nucleotidyltransferase domain-containing protein [Hydrogenimonas thermophila]WOE71047.1 nucleotidyltransferase domain-containing protein [Hydrogenimonas thermophila]WOE73565.1 nucleotidyltransferase domain-containing protein [Hydrogenimonas thermophila]SFP84413.1 Nucleotidyltransferase domain-containing protein [Hydrogenimonas thermophila]